MIQLTDELLVAYVDGELSAEDVTEIERALETDQNAREAVRIFRDSADWPRRAFDEVLHEPVPERLIRAALGEKSVASTEGSRTEGSRTEGSRQAATWQTRARSPLAGLAMAASVAMMIGVGGGLGVSGLIGQSEPGSTGQLLVGTVDQSDGLHAALEDTLSGTMTRIAETGDIIPMATFVEHNGHYCREFQAKLSAAGGPNAAFGIACRNSDGGWQVEAVVAVPDPDKDQIDHFVVASGNEDPLQLLIDTMSKAGPIPLDAEAALLASGWN